MVPGLSRSVINRIIIALITCWLCLTVSGHIPNAIAHAQGQNYLYFRIGENSISARAEISMEGLNNVLDLGFPKGKTARRKDIKPHLTKIKDYLSDHLKINCQPQTCNLEFQDFSFLNTTFTQFLLVNYEVIGFQTLPDTLQVTYDVILPDDSSHYTNMVLIEENWKTGTFGNESNPLLVFNEPGLTQNIDLTSGSLLQGFTSIVKLGIEHILEGIDHVLFLVALLLPSVVQRRDGRWQPVGKFSTALIYLVKVATVFTIAHSISLCLATLQIVEVPSRLVESVIAASIGLAAIDIFYPIFRRKMWLIIIAFGLFHGFGFAQVLAQLGVTRQHTFLSLFGFNLGIEIGQLAIIAVIFPLLYLIRKQWFYSRYILRGGGGILVVVSLYWLIERAFDVNLQILPTLQGLF